MLPNLFFLSEKSARNLRLNGGERGGGGRGEKRKREKKGETGGGRGRGGRSGRGEDQEGRGGEKVESRRDGATQETTKDEGDGPPAGQQQISRSGRGNRKESGSSGRETRKGTLTKGQKKHGNASNADRRRGNRRKRPKQESAQRSDRASRGARRQRETAAGSGGVFMSGLIISKRPAK